MLCVVLFLCSGCVRLSPVLLLCVILVLWVMFMLCFRVVFMLCLCSVLCWCCIHVVFV